MIRRIAWFAVCGTLYLPVGSYAQAGMTSDAPEFKRMEFLVGKWQTEGTFQLSKDAPTPTKVTGIQTCDWFQGHFQIVCQSDLTTPDGPVKGMDIIAYSSGDGTYRWFHLDGDGGMASPTGTVEGKTWAWRENMKDNGKSIRLDARWTQTSPDSYSTEVFLTEAGKKPVKYHEGKATRIK